MSQPRPARPTSSLLAAVVITVCGLLFGAPVQAQSNGHTYDIDTLGIPKFVNTVYIDLAKITQLSRFRSNAGHDYSDSTQFGISGYKGPPDNRIEGCSSMKHYFMAPDATVKIYAPVSGKITRMFDEAIGGTQVQIEPDDFPAFSFAIFHVALNQPFAVGDHLEAGQHIGQHTV